MNKSIFRVGLLLGVRQIQHSSLWTNVLIVSVMVLTFLNLVVVSGILVGLIEGSIRANRDEYTGDVFLSTPAGEEYIERSSVTLATLDAIDGVEEYSARYTQGATLEANYKNRTDPNELKDTVGARLVGIDPIKENSVTGIYDFVVEGEFLNPNEEGFVVVGANLLDRYASDFGEGFDSLEGVYPGDRIKMTSNGSEKEFIVKGVIDSKVGETSIRVFMPYKEMRRFVSRDNLNVNEIAVKKTDALTAEELKDRLIATGLNKTSVVRTSREAIGQFLEDIATTFGILGTVIGGIGLIVASITIFIVVFINAITRRKFIGILKGIGIEPRAIELSYVFQAIVYALIGSLIAGLIIYLVLVPFFDAHPLDFPFSDGILVAPPFGTFIRFIVLLITTIIAGYIPAWMIIKKNTLDAIIGR